MDGYDIALIKLDRVSDSPLPNLDTLGNLYMPGNVFSALGWGFDSSGSFTDLLQIADMLPFVSTRICNLERYWAGQIMESMICAGTGEQDTQQGNTFFESHGLAYSESCSRGFRWSIATTGSS